MTSPRLHVVTGAFGYIGRYIACRLLAEGHQVRTLTGHPGLEDPFGGRVPAFPFNFQDPAALVASLQGADTLFNTYWVRFDRGGTTFDGAAANLRILFDAARQAGVRRIVHISVANPSADSSLPYFRGKAMVERHLAASGVSHAILRPTLVFGQGDLLLNNIAWALRRFPVFPVAGDGGYRVQPVSVEDVAALAVGASQGDDYTVLDAAGPEVYTFNEMLRLTCRAVGGRAKLLHLPVPAALALTGLAGLLVRDVVLTRDELAGLMAELLVSEAAPTGSASFRQWLERHGSSLGVRYVSEVRRHFR